jgi:hypothetical protein
LGRDKFENEDLIRWGLDCDYWFHAEDLSSAHVYLRLPDDKIIDDVPENVLNEVFQLVKEGSKDGRKKEFINICMTPWSNLKKTGEMETGAIGYKDDKNVKIYKKIYKDKDVLKSLQKSMEDIKVDFETVKNEYYREQTNKNRKLYLEKRRLEKEEQEKYNQIHDEKKFKYMDVLGNEISNKDGNDFEEDFW